jgi:hypothetical protein
MDLRFMIANEGLRDYTARLERAASARTVAEIHHRMRARTRLRKAILEIVKLGGENHDLANELDGLIRSAECRLGDCT